MSDKSSKSFPLCDLCGDHHERLAGEKEGECPEAWAVEHFRQYESMYLKWVESEQKLQAAEEREKILMDAVEFYADRENWRPHNQVKYSDICDEDIRHSNRLHQCGGLKAEQALEKVGGGE